MNPNIMNFIAAEADFDEARAVIFGAPFDGTTSFRPGTRFGPGAIRAESDGIETYSPYQNKDLEDIAVFDSGDLLLPFGNTEAVLEEICARTAEILEAGKMPVMLGGEHLVTLGAVRAMVQNILSCTLFISMHTPICAMTTSASVVPCHRHPPLPRSVGRWAHPPVWHSLRRAR